MSTKVNPNAGKDPMKVERNLFFGPMFFFFAAAAAYGFISKFEPIGTIAILCLGFMFAFVGGYLWLLSRNIDPRPMDNPEGEIAEMVGEYDDHFNPHSWWPLAAGAAVTIVAAGLAVGWWLFGIGAVLGIVTLLGYAFENNRGVYKH